MSQTSAVPNPQAARVPYWLPMGFIAYGLLSGLILLVLLAWSVSTLDYYRLHPMLLTIVHLFTLGFGSAVTFGALYQMAPVVLVSKLYSPRIAWLSLATYIPGSALIAASFRTFYYPGLALGATLVILASVLFVYNMGRTWQLSEDDGLTRRYLLPAVLSFLIAVLIGFTIALAWQFGFRLPGVGGRPADLLGTHLFFGAGGWFTAIIIGVSYRLVGMFRLVHGHDEQVGGLVLKLLYASVVIGAVGSLTGGAVQWFITVALVLAMIALGMYAADFSRFWKKGVREPDIWMQQVPWAIGYAVASVLLLTVFYIWTLLFGDNLSTEAVMAAGILFGLGWIGTMILTLLHKIIPFLTWYHRYSSNVGKEKVPLMKDLVMLLHPRLQAKR